MPHTDPDEYQPTAYFKAAGERVREVAATSPQARKALADIAAIQCQPGVLAGPGKDREAGA